MNYRRLVSALTALHERLEDAETLLDRMKRLAVQQGRKILEIEAELAEALGEPGDDEGEEGDEGDEYEEGEEGEEGEGGRRESGPGLVGPAGTRCAN